MKKIVAASRKPFIVLCYVAFTCPILNFESDRGENGKVGFPTFQIKSYTKFIHSDVCELI